MDIIDNIATSIKINHYDSSDLKAVLTSLYTHGWNEGHKFCQNEQIKFNRKKKIKQAEYEKSFMMAAIDFPNTQA